MENQLEHSEGELMALSLSLQEEFLTFEEIEERLIAGNCTSCSCYCTSTSCCS